MKKTALITGASSGIGQATALALAKLDYQIILCGRRKDALKSVADNLSNLTATHKLVFDVSNNKAVTAAIKSIPDSFSKIDVLINNAGNAHGLDAIQNGAISDWDAMIDSNIRGVLYVSKAIITGMIKRGSGHIINIGSTAAKEVYPNGNVYCATKSAVDAITVGMRIDLNPYGIKVGAIHPGMVNTNFSNVRFKGDQERAASVYSGFDPLQASDIADIIAFMVSRPAHVSIADLVVFPTAQASSTLVKREVK